MARVWLWAAGAAVALCLVVPCGSAWASDDWWGSQSDTDQRTVVDAMYSLSGQSAPYGEEQARGERVADLLVQKGAETTGAAGEELGAQELSAQQDSQLLPRTGLLLTRLGPVAEATPETALVLVGTAVIYAVYRNVSMEMDAGPVNSQEATGFQYTGFVTWAYPGTSIYFGATVPAEGAYLFDAKDWQGPVRWFDEPCTFSGFQPPSGAHMMTGVSSTQPGTQPRCRYPLPAPIYYGEADVYVDYPYLSEGDVHPGGPWKPSSESDPNPHYANPGPAPPVSVAGPGIASALGGDGGPLGDALDEALLAADLLAQNEGDITEEEAPVVARECLRRVAEIGDPNPRELCRSLPILSEGADVAEATDHDIDALDFNPAWVLLHYVPADMREGNQQWYLARPECNTPEQGKACHEYPFWATAEGGPFATPLPRLKMVDAADNSLHGSHYSGFLSHCHITAPGTPWLGVPLSPALGVPTLKLCNASPPVP